MARARSDVFDDTVGLARDGRRAHRWLTPAERAQCSLLATEAQRADYRAARLAARSAARWLPGVADAPRRMALLRRVGGPPALWLRRARGGWRRARVAVSVAHRDGCGAAVVAPRGVRVGIDLERRGSVAPGHVHYFATEAERAAGPRDAAALWALKEAAWKALRLGPSCPLRALTLQFDERARVCGVTLHGTRLRARGALARAGAMHLVALVRVEGA